ncbi:hypothetical protein [Paenibacillus sp. LHD-38]|uniref:hypothetical protein n=1 Tax=Paenibacillus sp. LHD-38 TaxID=3072143 RepID=UPI00280F0DD0|nr:hypothetical protein [Paenibacillus sp. LHD-38]MDQ8739336.1 hypothetical protein [Paenibacillus sp. LHD-38]
MSVTFFGQLKDRKLIQIRGNIEMIREDIVKFENTLREYEYVLPLIPDGFEMKKHIIEDYQMRKSIHSTLTDEVSRLESQSMLRIVPK